LRGLYGGALLAAPSTLARAYTGRDPRPVDLMLVRILGVRQLVQALACSGRADRAAFQLGAEVDLGHVATTITAALLSESLRRAALIDTAVAGGFAAAGQLAARTWRQGPPLPEGVLGRLCRLRDRTASAVARVLVPGAARAVRRSPAG
jgi:hypothetical protein